MKNVNTLQDNQYLTSGDLQPKSMVPSVLILLVVTLAVYCGVLDNEFLDLWDDGYYVTSNPFINSGFSLLNVKAAFTEVVAHNWHPVTMLSHMLDVVLFGLNPACHHLTNVLLHCSNTILIYLFLHISTKRKLPALFAALFFAVHPLHVESVAWVSERKDLLSSFFILLALCVYYFYTQSESVRRTRILYGAVCSLHLLGLLSKSMVVTFPLLLLIVDYWPLDRFKRHTASYLVTEKIPLLCFSCVFICITLLTQTGTYPFALKDNVVASAYAYIHHLVYFYAPLSLSYLYSYSVKPSITEIVIGIAVCGYLLRLIIVAGAKYRFLIAGLLMYVVLYVPVSGIIRVGAHRYADRYMYLPMLGLIIITVYGIAAYLNKKNQMIPVLVIMTVTYGALAFQYEKSWNSQRNLYLNALSVGSLGNKTKEAIHANVCLGIYYFKKGDADSAIPYLYEALLRRVRYGESGKISLSQSDFYELRDYALLIMDDSLIEDVVNSYNILTAYYLGKKDYFNALIVINRGLAVHRKNTYLLDAQQFLKGQFLD